jgi:DNA-binding NarL/FixJ family response regulator
VILADDHEAILEQAVQLLEPYFEVITMVRNGKAAVEAVEQTTPDLVLLDVAMPVLDGIDTARELRRCGYQGKIAFLTVQEDPMFVSAALNAGACAYILKKGMVKELVHAVEQALDGGTYFSPALRLQPHLY